MRQQQQRPRTTVDSKVNLKIKTNRILTCFCWQYDISFELNAKSLKRHHSAYKYYNAEDEIQQQDDDFTSLNAHTPHTQSTPKQCIDVLHWHSRTIKNPTHSSWMLISRHVNLRVFGGTDFPQTRRCMFSRWGGTQQQRACSSLIQTRPVDQTNFSEFLRCCHTTSAN